MNTMKRISILAALFFIGSAGCSPVIRQRNGGWVPIIVAQTGKIESSSQGKYVSLACRFTNDSEHVINYRGYKADSFGPPLSPGHIVPIHTTRYKQNGQWQTYQQLFCGYGMAFLDFEPGASAGFDIWLPDHAASWEAIKVGFKCSWFNPQGEKISKMIWSNEVAVEDI